MAAKRPSSCLTPPPPSSERIDRPFFVDVANLVASLAVRLDGRLDAIAAHRPR